MTTRNSAKPTYSIPVSNGIFAHRKRIGAAIWEFLWLIDHTTKEILAKDGKVEGLVYGGQPVPLNKIAADLDMSWNTIYEHLGQLTKAGYLRKIAHGNGRPNGYAVVNSKRNRRTKAGMRQPSNPPEKVMGTPPEKVMGTPPEKVMGTPPEKPGYPSSFLGEPPQKNHGDSMTRARALQDLTRHKDMDSEQITAEMVAAGVLQTLGLSGRELLAILVDVCRSELKRSETPDSLLESLISAWTDFSKARGDGKFTKYAPGAPRFFGEGIWKDRGAWPWKAGYSLPPIPGTGPPDANVLIRAEREELAKHPEREQAPAYLTGKI